MAEGFEKRLKEVLNSKGLTQIQAAQAIGITHGAFTNYMKGRIPSSEILLKIAQLCDVTIDWLLTGDEQYKMASLSPDEKELLDNYSLLNCFQKGKVHGYIGSLLSTSNKNDFNYLISQKKSG